MTLLGLPADIAEKELYGRQYTITYLPNQWLKDAGGQWRVIRVVESCGVLNITAGLFRLLPEDGAAEA